MKEAYYFKHDYNARSDEKMVNLFRMLGLEGYGIYWVLIEKLYESQGRIAADFDAIAYDLRTDSQKVKSVATKFGLFYFFGPSRLLASRSVDRRLQERRERSSKARESANALWVRRETMRSHSDRIATAMLGEQNIGEEKRKDKRGGMGENGQRQPLSEEESRLFFSQRLSWGKDRGVFVANLRSEICQWWIEKSNIKDKIRGELKKALLLRAKRPDLDNE